MIPTDFTTVGMVVCLAICVGILIYAASKGVKVNDGNHKALWAGVLSSLVIGLIIAGIHVWLVSQK